MDLEEIKKCFGKFLGSTRFAFFDSAIRKNEVVTAYTSYDVIFQGAEQERELLLSVVDYYTHRRVSLRIENKDGESHNSIDLFKYLEQYTDAEITPGTMLLDSYQGETFEEKLSNFFEGIRLLLDQRFFDIINGKDWIELPVDWQGYK